MKVLITSVSTGSGHVRAAEAIHAAFQETHPEINVTHVNVMDHVSKPFRRLYEDGYAFLADKAPMMWGWLYGKTDKKGNYSNTQRAINAFQRNCAAPFLKLVDSTKPDIILTTHFLVPQIFSSGVLFYPVPLECVITDYDLHRIWLDPAVGRYYVGDEIVREKFLRMGVNEQKAVVSGIPIHPVFDKELQSKCNNFDWRMDPGIPTLLLLSGGLGVGSVEQTLRGLFSIQTPIQIITVAGKNADLRKRLIEIKAPAHIRTLHLGFVTNMHELMRVADIVVTKAGGLTTAECLAMQTAMVIYSAIPGQELKNTEYVVSNNAGCHAKNLDDLILIVQDLINNPREQAAIRANAQKLGRPRAAYAIADSVANCFSFA